MVKIKHILSDGKQISDITGHVINADDFKVLYEVISGIKKEGDAKCHV